MLDNYLQHWLGEVLEMLNKMKEGNGQSTKDEQGSNKDKLIPKLEAILYCVVNYQRSN